ncbi:SIMPL domain-containing protein [Actinoplanes sp. NPDC024001]|uniref:SIMPL domain-containing protein n=1 Tax=Actinoplanes sp. NPDC024001 TaxID=3154598 RepID=UPI00340B0F5E
MERLPVVVTRGEAVRQVPPELAVVHVRTAVKGKPTRAAVLERLAEGSAAVGAVLDEFADAIERRESTNVDVYPEWNPQGGETGAFEGSAGVNALVTDFTVLGDLIVRLAGVDLAAVSGPSWQLRPGSRAGAEVRRAAVTDALSRAAEYAAAVGAEVDRLIEINDATELYESYTAQAEMDSNRSARSESSPVLVLEPQLQVVRAQVRVTVTISEPTLPGRPTGT